MPGFFCSSHLASLLHVSVSSTVAILRVLEGLLSLCSGAVLSSAFESLHWGLSGRARGLRLLCLLGLSPTSGLVGTLSLAFSKHACGADRFAALGRIGLFAAISVAGVVLLVRTRLQVVYGSAAPYNVTAGVGQFNGSYIPEYLQRFQTTNDGYGFAVLPYSTVITASNLVINPMHSTPIDPVACQSDRVCHGFLISGGLMMTTPWPPVDEPSYPVVSVRDAPATQIDFVRGIHNDAFDDANDCTTFGGEGFLIGIKFCLARSQSTIGSLFAGSLTNVH